MCPFQTVSLSAHVLLWQWQWSVLTTDMETMEIMIRVNSIDVFSFSFYFLFLYIFVLLGLSCTYSVPNLFQWLCYVLSVVPLNISNGENVCTEGSICVLNCTRYQQTENHQGRCLQIMLAVISGLLKTLWDRLWSHCTCCQQNTSCSTKVNGLPAVSRCLLCPQWRWTSSYWWHHLSSPAFCFLFPSAAHSHFYRSVSCVPILGLDHMLDRSEWARFYWLYFKGMTT